VLAIVEGGRHRSVGIEIESADELRVEWWGRLFDAFDDPRFASVLVKEPIANVINLLGTPIIARRNGPVAVV
jgi:hypothetical protein